MNRLRSDFSCQLRLPKVDVFFATIASPIRSSRMFESVGAKPRAEPCSAVVDIDIGCYVGLPAAGPKTASPSDLRRSGMSGSVQLGPEALSLAAILSKQAGIT
jgi:hypothetical protein